MAENEAPQGAQGNETDPNAPKPTPPGSSAKEVTDWEAEAKKILAESRKHEDRSKEWKAKAEANQAAADRLHELEEASKSEAERLAARLAEAEAKVATYEKRDQLKTWAKEITEGSQVPASALRGSTREELEAHFEDLKKLIPPPAGETDPQGRPIVTVGQQPGVARTLSLDEQIRAAEAAGNTELVAQLKAMKLSTSAVTKTN